MMSDLGLATVLGIRVLGREVSSRGSEVVHVDISIGHGRAK